MKTSIFEDGLFVITCLFFIAVGIIIGFAIRDYQFKDYAYIDNGKVIMKEENK